MIAAAVGLQQHDSYADRKATLARKLEQKENARAAAERDLNERRSIVNSAAAAETAKLQAEAEAHELALSVELAKEVRAALEPLFSQLHAEGLSRKLSVKVATFLRESNARSLHTLGAPLDPIAIASAFAAVLVKDDPALVSVFHAIDSYYGPAIEASTKLLELSESGYATAIEAPLAELERALEHTARTAPRSAPTPEHAEALEILRSHAVPKHRTHVTHEVSRRHADARSAAWAAEYRAPTVVHNDASGSRVSFDAPAVVRDDDGNESVVERGHFEKLEQVDFERL